MKMNTYTIKIILFFIIFIYILLDEKEKGKRIILDVKLPFKHSKKDFENTTFGILIREHCDSCGLFSYYIKFLGCIVDIILNGEIPIIDMQTYGNLYNGFKDNSSINPWELFFNQVQGYNLNEVKKYGKKLNYYICPSDIRAPNREFFNNDFLIKFWHDMHKLYMTIKSNIVKEADTIMKKYFKKDKNILGALIRGTDFVSAKPKSHPIPPKPELLIKDLNKMDKLYNYSYFFLSTEDAIIRKKFIKIFGTKLKYLKYKKDIHYDYKNKKFLYNNDKVVGNIKFVKIYILNIIILSKCLDIITCRTNGSVGIFIFTEGFRNSKIYYLGNY